MCFPTMHLTSQLEEVVVEEFDGAIPELVWLIGRVFSNLWTSWNIGDISYGLRFFFLKKIPAQETPSINSTIMLCCPRRELVVRHVIYLWVSCQELCPKLNSCNIIFIDFINLFCSVGYLIRELHTHKVIPLQALPSFMNWWADMASDICIF